MIGILFLQFFDSYCDFSQFFHQNLLIQNIYCFVYNFSEMVATQTQTQTETQNVDQSQNPNSPFYIHPSDNPGMKLVSEKFNVSCYDEWKRSMIISLSAKNKMGFVDGSIKKPDATDINYKVWDKCNSNDILVLGVSEQDIARSVLYFQTSHEIWANLEERFGQASGTTLFALQQTLQEIKQGTDIIFGYFTKMKKLWDQLDSKDPLPSCSCTNCTCELTKKLVKSQEDGRLIEFLMKLNEGYEIVRGNILIMSLLPSISHVYRLLMQEENLKRLYQNQEVQMK